MKKVICISTYPPRECGIATFSQDLVRAIMSKFGNSYSIQICAVESNTETHSYAGKEEVKYILNTSNSSAYTTLTTQLNESLEADIVLVQHEFGLYAEQEEAFMQMLEQLRKPVILTFHTLLSKPTYAMCQNVSRIIAACMQVVVMTQTSRHILIHQYHVDEAKIKVIPHGTHLVSFKDKNKLKELYQLSGRRVLSTFGLLSSGKSIETTLDALPVIVEANPSIIFLILGKTHPGVFKMEGERYRERLKIKIKELHLEKYVLFINQYLELSTLLEYLQLTDVYLFTSSDPNQAVSGTFVYAISCGCPIIATPIPHALELLSDNSGVIFDFKDFSQLAVAANRLLADKKLRTKMKLIGLQKTAATAWENVAIAYATLFQETGEDKLIYSLPPINTFHVQRMSRQWGIIQFSKGNLPDSSTGYTLDDTARALMAMCQVVATGKGEVKEKYIKIYLNFIGYCQQSDGSFLNYVDKDGIFTSQNKEVGLEDSNGRAICALGYFISCAASFPVSWKGEAEAIFKRAFQLFERTESPRSIAFMLKGLYYYRCEYPSTEIDANILLLADKLAQYYRWTKEGKWRWFEAYLTYDNGVLPEAMLMAYLAIGKDEYKDIAYESFEFLLEKVFVGNRLQVISNQGWLHKGGSSSEFGEQPIDVAGMVIALRIFYLVFKKEKYRCMQNDAFNWFLGNNHLNQIVYNPATGGCYDGLEENNINLNQGAESTVCYLMARLALLSDL